MHVHIALALSVETFLRRVKDTRTTLTPDFLIQREHRYYPTLQDFHGTYEQMRHITSTPSELAEVVQSYLERIAREGCIYAELSSSYRPGLDFARQIEAVSAGIRAAEANTGITARIVVTTLRDSGAEVAEAAVQEIIDLKEPLVSAFGLVGNEAVTPLPEFRQALNRAWHEAGVGLVPHVAEQRIENALDFFLAVPADAFENPRRDHRKLRIGHGTLIHRSSELLKRFADHQICFEVCLSANKRIGVPPDIAKMHEDGRAYTIDRSLSVGLDRELVHYFKDLTTHPMRVLLAHGIPICLGSDNPLLMNSNIGKEYALSRKYLGCSFEECLGFTRNAILYANVERETERKLLELMRRYDRAHADGQHATVLGYQDAKDNLER
jgi:adenosine deaminase